MTKTYFTVWFSSEGATPDEVTSRLMGMGFKAIKGRYDYVYTWSGNPNVDEILDIGNRILLTLKGMHVLFKIETI